MAVIGQIRNRLGWLLIAFIGFAIVAFLLMDIGAGQGQGNRTTDNTLAEVNGMPLDYLEFNEKYDQNVQNAYAQNGGAELSEFEQNQLRENTYNQMVNEQLFNETYDELGIDVSKVEVVDMTTGKTLHYFMEQNFAGEDGTFDAALFNNHIATLDIDNPGTEIGSKRREWNNIEDALIQDRHQTKYFTLVNNGLTVPTWMAQMQNGLNNSSVNVEYVMLPYTDIDNATLEITDADLQKYADEHAGEFEAEESVAMKYVKFPIVPSQNDYIVESTWMAEKTTEWTTSENDSIFVRLYSESAWDPFYYTEAELISKYADTLFTAEEGAIFGPSQNLNQFEVVKLIDRKLIADSLQARHLLLSGENLQTQDDVIAINALADSLYTLVDSLGVSLSSLTAQYSDDKANSFNGGDLGWVFKGQMVAPFEYAIFHQMNEGDVKIVYSEFGIHIVEVYKSEQTTPAVKVAKLTRTVYPSDETINRLYADANTFGGNHNTLETFAGAADSVNMIDAPSVAKMANTLPQLQGNARQLVKWAFNNEEGAVSAPFAVGEDYVVAIVNSKNEGGNANLDAVRVEVIKEKKAEQLIAKMSGTDIASIASANGKTVTPANGVNFNN
ncbi:MAG: peptidylprolyl isomerase, partial [Chitinophagales bacterium]